MLATNQHAVRARKWRKENQARSREIAMQNYYRQKEKANRLRFKILEDNPCYVCKEKRVGCLIFHHLDPSKKEMGVCEVTWRRMLDEAEKCIVLCCNCHTLHHHGYLPLPSTIKPLDTSDYRKLAVEWKL